MRGGRRFLRDDHAIRDCHSDRRRFLAGGAAGRGAGVCARLVLRHADAERRPVCRDGCGGDEDDEDPARHRGADPVEPHRPGYRERLCLAEQIGAGADRFRGRHRVYRAAGDGARRGQAGGYGRVCPRRHGAVARGDGRGRNRKQKPADPAAEPGARADQYARPDPALRRGLGSAGAQLDREARRRLDRHGRRCRGRRRGDGRHAGMPAGRRARARSRSMPWC